jgi:hypothetical protein
MPHLSDARSSDMLFQTVKWNKDECVRLMENIHELLYTIVDLHIRSKTGGTLPPGILHHIGKFTEYFSLHLVQSDLGLNKCFQNTPQDS